MPVRTIPKLPEPHWARAQHPYFGDDSVRVHAGARLPLVAGFDPDVEFFEEQPVKIIYHDAHGQRRTYTPDVLVRYRPIASRHGAACAV